MVVEQVVLMVAVDLPRHQVLTTDVSAIHRIGHADLRHDILPIPSMDMGNCGIPAAGCLAVPQAVRAIGIGGRDTAGYRRGDRSQLSKSIIRPCFLPVNDQLFKEVFENATRFSFAWDFDFAIIKNISEKDSLAHSYAGMEDFL